MTKEELEKMSIFGHLYLNSLRPSDGYMFIRTFNSNCAHHFVTSSADRLWVVHECDKLFNKAGKLERQVSKLNKRSRIKHKPNSRSQSEATAKAQINRKIEEIEKLKKEAKRMWQEEINYALTL